ncbi:MAG TPA: hypothetical protein VHO90_18540 [Bacteroidales bacterium]|nr:hypothetical protein [Bacteroidales bacterium]
MAYFFTDWKEDETTVYEGQANNNFGISFKNDSYEVQFIKDRGLLELKIYYKNELVPLGYLLYNSILEKNPSQDSKWRTRLCVELIDFYLYFLQKYFIKSKDENV